MQTESLYTFTVMLTLSAFSRFAVALGEKAALGTGLLAGIGAMVCPTAVVPLAGAVLGWILLRREDARRHGVKLAGVALMLAAVLTPWAVRNARVFGAFVPLSSGGGELFYMGTTPETDGRRIPPHWLTLRWPLIGQEEKRLGRKLNAVGRDRPLLRAGLENWRRYPGRSVVISLKRLRRLCFVPLNREDRFVMRWDSCSRCWCFTRWPGRAARRDYARTSCPARLPGSWSSRSPSP